MGQKITDLGTALGDAATAAGDAALAAIRAGDETRKAVGSVVLAGVSTKAALLSAVPVEIAIAIARRLPFADSPSICAAARDASRHAVDFVPYLVTIETLFVEPATLALGTAYPQYGGMGVAATGALAKASLMLTLLADVPDIDPTNPEASLRDIGDDARRIVGRLLNSVTDIFDPADLLIARPFDEALIAKLTSIKDAVDAFVNDPDNVLTGLLAGVPKIFNAAERGAERMHAAIEAQNAVLCGSERQPARAFFERRHDTISLDRAYPSIAAGSGSWALLVDGNRQDLFSVDAVGEQSRAEFGLTGKTTELTLEHRRTNNPLLPLVLTDGPFGLPVMTLPPKFESALEPFARRVRALTVFAESERIEIGERPLDTMVAGKAILLDTLSDDLEPGQKIIITGVTSAGDRAAELATISSLSTVSEAQGAGQPPKKFTLIELSEDLSAEYVRTSMRINANVALATHGESINELLGSGNAAARHQRFALKQGPLTYVAAVTDTGRASTLSVRVNDLLWSEVATLVGRGPRDRVFATRTDDDGRTTVQFGDGIEGAVPPSGPNNIRAGYRKGIGAAGNVGANRLTTLLTRPAGLASVTNPMGAGGGEDRESIAQSRDNAPMTVRTLERAVSLTDYEDFATTFAGVGKALATWLPGTASRGILLTISNADGSAVEDGSETPGVLMDALRRFGDPLVPIDIVSLRPVRFKVKGTVTLAADCDPAVVMPQVARALERRFSFAAMPFAQSISIDDVMAAMHTVDAVVAVDVDALYRSDPPMAQQWNARVDAAGPSVDGAGEPAGAELLTIDLEAGDLAHVQLNGVAR